MDIRKLKKLIELLQESDVAEIEIHEGEESIRISRHGTVAPPLIASAPSLPRAFSRIPAGTPGPAPESAVLTADETPEKNLVRFPVVGTFYRAPAPGSRPFVEEGEQVKVGATLCIIEAMKILNQIECEKDGTIARVLVENGQPVEYNQPLFVIE